MLILVGCEFSGVVREAFRKRGHQAYSCDLRPAEDGSPYHLQMDLLELLSEGYPWDFGIFHPPCTHLAVSGAKWFEQKRKDGRQQQAIEFFMECCCSGLKRWVVENPVCIMSKLYRKPDQIIQPWQFGHTEQKKTCLWLQNVPLLKATNNVYEQMMLLPKNQRERLHYFSPSESRERERSKTYQGIANAMAEQWGVL